MQSEQRMECCCIRHGVYARGADRSLECWRHLEAVGISLFEVESRRLMAARILNCTLRQVIESVERVWHGSGSVFRRKIAPFMKRQLIRC